MVIYNNSLLNHLNITEENTTRIIECIFEGLHNEVINGGAISVTCDECNFYCYDSFFHNCSAQSSGGIHISKCQNIICSHICAISCSNTKSYSYFSYLYSSSNLYCTYFSTHFCSGYASTTDFASSQVTVSNINSTHNNGYQEPGFLISKFDNAFLQYADCISNIGEIIGMNTYSAKNAELKNVHFENSSLTKPNSGSDHHIFFHNVQNAIFSDSYVNIDPEAIGFSITSKNSEVIVKNVYLIGLIKVYNIEDERIIKGSFKTKTQHYSFLNNLNCPAIKEICLTCKPKNHVFSFMRFIGITLILVI